ncbi:mucin-19-like isoform X2 [Littorina saxatilis]|uniref:Uncharacterized protein n=1 Tax=Littorina saxatilis TaxID=31220 RepID=A0AAN9AWA6_9CAEN
MNKKATFLNKFQSLLLAQIENARARKAEDEMAMSENKRENHCDNVALLLHPKPKKPRHVQQQSAGSTHVIHKGADENGEQLPSSSKTKSNSKGTTSGNERHSKSLKQITESPQKNSEDVFLSLSPYHRKRKAQSTAPIREGDGDLASNSPQKIFIVSATEFAQQQATTADNDKEDLWSPQADRIGVSQVAGGSEEARDHGGTFSWNRDDAEADSNDNGDDDEEEEEEEEEEEQQQLHLGLAAWVAGNKNNMALTSDDESSGCGDLAMSSTAGCQAGGTEVEFELQTKENFRIVQSGGQCRIMITKKQHQISQRKKKSRVTQLKKDCQVMEATEDCQVMETTEDCQVVQTTQEFQITQTQQYCQITQDKKYDQIMQGTEASQINRIMEDHPITHAEDACQITQGRDSRRITQAKETRQILQDTKSRPITQAKKKRLGMGVAEGHQIMQAKKTREDCHMTQVKGTRQITGVCEKRHITQIKDDRQITAFGEWRQITQANEDRQITAFGEWRQITQPNEERQITALPGERQSKQANEERQITALPGERQSKQAKEERQITALPGERQSTHAKVERQITVLPGERQSTHAKEERQITTLPGERQSTQAKVERQITALPGERQSTHAKEERQITALPGERQSTQANEERQITALPGERQSKQAKVERQMTAFWEERQITQPKKSLRDKRAKEEPQAVTTGEETKEERQITLTPELLQFVDTIGEYKIQQAKEEGSTIQKMEKHHQKQLNEGCLTPQATKKSEITKVLGKREIAQSEKSLRAILSLVTAQKCRAMGFKRESQKLELAVPARVTKSNNGGEVRCRKKQRALTSGERVWTSACEDYDYDCDILYRVLDPLKTTYGQKQPLSLLEELRMAEQQEKDKREKARPQAQKRDDKEQYKLDDGCSWYAEDGKYVVQVDDLFGNQSNAPLGTAYRQNQPPSLPQELQMADQQGKVTARLQAQTHDDLEPDAQRSDTFDECCSLNAEGKRVVELDDLCEHQSLENEGVLADSIRNMEVKVEAADQSLNIMISRDDTKSVNVDTPARNSFLQPASLSFDPNGLLGGDVRMAGANNCNKTLESSVGAGFDTSGYGDGCSEKDELRTRGCSNNAQRAISATDFMPYESVERYNENKLRFFKTNSPPTIAETFKGSKRYTHDQFSLPSKLKPNMFNVQHVLRRSLSDTSLRFCLDEVLGIHMDTALDRSCIASATAEQWTEDVNTIHLSCLPAAQGVFKEDCRSMTTESEQLRSELFKDAVPSGDSGEKAAGVSKMDSFGKNTELTDPFRDTSNTEASRMEEHMLRCFLTLNNNSLPNDGVKGSSAQKLPGSTPGVFLGPNADEDYLLQYSYTRRKKPIIRGRFPQALMPGSHKSKSRADGPSESAIAKVKVGSHPHDCKCLDYDCLRKRGEMLHDHVMKNVNVLKQFAVKKQHRWPNCSVQIQEAVGHKARELIRHQRGSLRRPSHLSPSCLYTRSVSTSSRSSTVTRLRSDSTSPVRQMVQSTSQPQQTSQSTPSLRKQRLSHDGSNTFPQDTPNASTQDGMSSVKSKTARATRPKSAVGRHSTTTSQTAFAGDPGRTKSPEISLNKVETSESQHSKTKLKTSSIRSDPKLVSRVSPPVVDCGREDASSTVVMNSINSMDMNISQRDLITALLMSESGTGFRNKSSEFVAGIRPKPSHQDFGMSRDPRLAKSDKMVSDALNRLDSLQHGGLKKRGKAQLPWFCDQEILTPKNTSSYYVSVETPQSDPLAPKIGCATKTHDFSPKLMTSETTFNVVTGGELTVTKEVSHRSFIPISDRTTSYFYSISQEKSPIILKDLPAADRPQAEANNSSNSGAHDKDARKTTCHRRGLPETQESLCDNMPPHQLTYDTAADMDNNAAVPDNRKQRGKSQLTDSTRSDQTEYFSHARRAHLSASITANTAAGPVKSVTEVKELSTTHGPRPKSKMTSTATNRADLSRSHRSQRMMRDAALRSSVPVVMETRMTVDGPEGRLLTSVSQTSARSENKKPKSQVFELSLTVSPRTRATQQRRRLTSRSWSPTASTSSKTSRGFVHNSVCSCHSSSSPSPRRRTIRSNFSSPGGRSTASDQSTPFRRTHISPYHSPIWEMLGIRPPPTVSRRSTDVSPAALKQSKTTSSKRETRAGSRYDSRNRSPSASQKTRTLGSSDYGSQTSTKKTPFTSSSRKDQLSSDHASSISRKRSSQTTPKEETYPSATASHRVKPRIVSDSTTPVSTRRQSSVSPPWYSGFHPSHTSVKSAPPPSPKRTRPPRLSSPPAKRAAPPYISPVRRPGPTVKKILKSSKTLSSSTEVSSRPRLHSSVPDGAFHDTLSTRPTPPAEMMRITESPTKQASRSSTVSRVSKTSREFISSAHSPPTSPHTSTRKIVSRTFEQTVSSPSGTSPSPVSSAGSGFLSKAKRQAIRSTENTFLDTSLSSTQPLHTACFADDAVPVTPRDVTPRPVTPRSRTTSVVPSVTRVVPDDLALPFWAQETPADDTGFLSVIASSLKKATDYLCTDSLTNVLEEDVDRLFTPAGHYARSDVPTDSSPPSSAKLRRSSSSLCEDGSSTRAVHRVLFEDVNADSTPESRTSRLTSKASPTRAMQSTFLKDDRKISRQGSATKTARSVSLHSKQSPTRPVHKCFSGDGTNVSYRTKAVRLDRTSSLTSKQSPTRVKGTTFSDNETADSPRSSASRLDSTSFIDSETQPLYQIFFSDEDEKKTNLASHRHTSGLEPEPAMQSTLVQNTTESPQRDSAFKTGRSFSPPSKQSPTRPVHKCFSDDGTNMSYRPNALRLDRTSSLPSKQSPTRPVHKCFSDDGTNALRHDRTSYLTSKQSPTRVKRTTFSNDVTADFSRLSASRLDTSSVLYSATQPLYQIYFSDENEKNTFLASHLHTCGLKPQWTIESETSTKPLHRIYFPDERSPTPSPVPKKPRPGTIKPPTIIPKEAKQKTYAKECTCHNGKKSHTRRHVSSKARISKTRSKSPPRMLSPSHKPCSWGLGATPGRSSPSPSRRKRSKGCRSKTRRRSSSPCLRQPSKGCGSKTCRRSPSPPLRQPSKGCGSKTCRRSPSPSPRPPSVGCGSETCRRSPSPSMREICSTCGGSKPGLRSPSTLLRDTRSAGGIGRPSPPSLRDTRSVGGTPTIGSRSVSWTSASSLKSGRGSSSGSFRPCSPTCSRRNSAADVADSTAQDKNAWVIRLKELLQSAIDYFFPPKPGSQEANQKRDAIIARVSSSNTVLSSALCSCKDGIPLPGAVVAPVSCLCSLESNLEVISAKAKGKRSPRASAKTVRVAGKKSSSSKKVGKLRKSSGVSTKAEKLQISSDVSTKQATVCSESCLPKRASATNVTASSSVTSTATARPISLWDKLMRLLARLLGRRGSGSEMLADTHSVESRQSPRCVEMVGEALVQSVCAYKYIHSRLQPYSSQLKKALCVALIVAVAVAVRSYLCCSTCCTKQIITKICIDMERLLDDFLVHLGLRNLEVPPL